MQAHTSGEVSILGTVLLRVYSGTTFPTFIENGLYLTEKEQKISWHSFFETRCILSCLFLPQPFTALTLLVGRLERCWPMKCFAPIVPRSSALSRLT